MRWLVTGAGGMLGADVLRALAVPAPTGPASGEHTAVGLPRADLDLTDADAVRAAVAEHRPDVVVNCAAYTAVDDAETDEATALAVNGAGARHLAAACAELDTRLVQVSTDYIFAGDADEPYDETEPPAPKTAYGRTKLAGELAVAELLPERGVIARTAWLYGAGGPNFVATMIRLESTRDSIDVVADQHGQPTWTADLAIRLIALGADPAANGVFHATSSGTATWYDLAREVFTLLGADPDRVRPTTTDAFPRPAPRPAYSVLGHRRWSEPVADGIGPIRHWRSALHAAWPSLHPA